MIDNSSSEQTWITRIRKELTSQRVRRQGGNIRAFETDNLCLKQ